MSAEDYVNECMKWHSIPVRYRDVRFSDLKGSSAFLDAVRKIKAWNFDEPYLLSLLSPNNGMGKTHMAWCLIKSFMLKSVLADFNYVDHNKDQYSKFFFKEYQILNHIKSNYNEDGRSEEDIKQIYKEKKLLVIDDLFRTKKSEWAISVWFEILDYRYDNFKPTVITSNFTIDEIRNDIDTSIVSRIQNSMTFQFFGDLQDFRSLE